MKSLKKNVFLVVLLGTGTLLTHGKAVLPVKGDATAEATRQQFLDEIAAKKAQIADLENLEKNPLRGAAGSDERLAEAEKRDTQITAIEKEIDEIRAKMKKHYLSTAAPSRLSTIMENDEKQEKKSDEKASQVKQDVQAITREISKVQEKIDQKHEEIAQLKEEKTESGKDDSTAHHDQKIKALQEEVKELKEEKKELHEEKKEQLASKKVSSSEEKRATHARRGTCPLKGKKGASCPRKSSCPHCSKSSSMKAAGEIEKNKHVSKMSKKERRKRRKDILKSKKKIQNIKNRKNRRKNNNEE